MSVLTVIRSECFRARHMRVGLILLLLYLGIAFLYVFAGAGAWVSSGIEGSFSGFSADPSYFDLIDVKADSGEYVIASALAHTVFFPILAVIVVGMLFGLPKGGASADVSRAKGVEDVLFLFARAVVSSAYLMAGYASFTLVASATYLAFGYTVDMGLLIQRLSLIILLNESYIMVCVVVFSIVRMRALASGGLIVATFAGLIAAMSSPGSIIPVHMSYWMQACGIATSGTSLKAVVFSLVSMSLCLLILYAMHRFCRALR